jgi:riboflavin kinase / FMN adenylyltransferase
MTAIKAFENLNIQKSWVTVGSFDGVHLGHQALAKQLVSQAHQQNGKAIVVTFFPHPAVFFNRVPAAYSMTSISERESLLKGLGVDEVITVGFDQQIADLSARDFMLAMKEKLGIVHLFAGFNFALGHNRNGDILALTKLGDELDFKVDVIPPFEINGSVVSSSQIRKFLTEGNLEKANQWLGRSFSLEGKVIHGEHRGNRLGIPTANLDIAPDRLLPSNGVYACKAYVCGSSHIAVTNIGVRPTFANPLASPRVEPHLLDLNDDLYGQDLRLEFIEYLRGEKTFASPQELIAQVNLDIVKTREVINNGE